MVFAPTFGLSRRRRRTRPRLLRLAQGSLDGPARRSPFDIIIIRDARPLKAIIAVVSVSQYGRVEPLTFR